MTDKAKILVIDDELNVCWVLGNVLSGLGCRVTFVTNGREALKEVKHGNFRIAFIDIKLTDMNGIDLCRLIREDAPDTRLILISGFYSPNDDIIQQGLKEGLFAEFIGKPFTPDQISQAVKEAL
ncbi:MAG: response regulator [Actinobacteria bacterium]|nr:response regulator [Actinomycetota bacterium]MCG2830978.1 response regulator [Desulfobacteraceae bacterium]